MADPLPGFAARKGELQSFEVTSRRELEDSVLTEIVLRSSSGLTVELALRRPHKPLSTRPILLMIAGQEAGREATMMFPTTRGVTVAALSYPYQGSRKFSRLCLALDLHRVQEAILDTAPAVMLANDYLLNHAELDSDNLELVGVSFGAFLAAVPAALDSRVRRVWLIHGAGDVAGVLERGLENNLPLAPLRALVARFLAATAGSRYLSPEKWVGRVAPRPVIVINGSDDDDLPAEAVRALHDALGEPSEVIWVEGGHIHPKRPETIIRVIEIMFQRIGERAGERPRCKTAPGCPENGARSPAS
jgi:hypothetical protein